MFATKIVLLALVALASCETVLQVHDELGNAYYLVPATNEHAIHRRDIGSVGTETIYGGGPNHVLLGEKFTIVDNKDHRLDASVYAERDYRPKGPLTTGQSVSYEHKPSASTFDLNTQNTRGEGTALQAKGTYNFYQTPDKTGSVGISGFYERFFSKLAGAGQPNYGVMVEGKIPF